MSRAVRGIDTLIVTGLVTHGCCDCTARDAFQYGYKTVIASNATAAMSDDEHIAALFNLDIYYADVVSCDALVAALGATRAVTSALRNTATA